MGMLTAVLLFGEAWRGATLQTDLSWRLAAFVCYTHISPAIVSVAC